MSTVAFLQRIEDDIRATLARDHPRAPTAAVCAALMNTIGSIVARECESMTTDEVVDLVNQIAEALASDIGRHLRAQGKLR